MLYFKIVVGLLALIAIMTGANDFWNGAAVKGDFGKHLGDNVNDPTLNFTIRFLGAIWMGFGFFLILFMSDVNTYKTALKLAFVIVIIGGIGRVISVYKHGIEKENKSMAYAILGVELLLIPILFIWLHYFLN